MATKIFVNLPVKDLNKSIAFFTQLGYTFDPKFTNDQATCMNISEDIFVMLLVESFYKTASTKAIADTGKVSESLICITVESREAVDTLVNKAVAEGAKLPKEKEDHGFMYAWGYEDLDGHIWVIMYMDPNPGK
jgi:predicted lactoylglutathione lyase